MATLKVPKGYEEYKRRRMKEAMALANEHFRNENEKVRSYCT